MKKWIAVFLALLATVCLLSVAVSAESVATLSEDLQVLTLEGQTYSRGDVSAIDLNAYDDTRVTLELTEQQQKDLKRGVVSTTRDSKFIMVDLYYRDGSILNITFISDQYKEELLQLCQSDDLVCGVEFYWLSDTKVHAPLKDFKGTPVTLTASDLYGCSTHQVVYYSRGMNVNVYRGAVLTDNDRLYFVDFRENDIVTPAYFYATEYDKLDAYEITNTEIYNSIKQIEDDYYIYGMDTDTDSPEYILTAVFLIFLFAVIPTAILVPSVIFFVRGKGYYRVTWGVTAGLCIAELAVFLSVVANILLT